MSFLIVKKLRINASNKRFLSCLPKHYTMDKYCTFFQLGSTLLLIVIHLFIAKFLKNANK